MEVIKARSEITNDMITREEARKIAILSTDTQRTLVSDLIRNCAERGGFRTLICPTNRSDRDTIIKELKDAHFTVDEDANHYPEYWVRWE